MALHSSSWRTRLAGVVRFIFFSIVNILENAKVASTFYFMVVASSAIALFLFVCCVLLYMCFFRIVASTHACKAIECCPIAHHRDACIC